jgi:hypothetical protein
MTEKISCIEIEDGGMVGWIDGWMYGWMNGWIDGWISVVAITLLNISSILIN